MKKFIYLLPFALVLSASCGENKNETTEETANVDTSLMYFGDSITMDGAIPAEMLGPKMASIDSFAIKVTGVVKEVCQKKGCWMTMDIGEQEIMQINFRDYAFFVPKDINGKTVVIEGLAFHDTTSIEQLRHFAEDAGKPKEEIEKIDAPQTNISFEAIGVIVKK